MSLSAKLNLKLKNATKLDHTHLSVSAINASEITEIKPKKPPKNIPKIVETLKHFYIYSSS